MERSDPVPPTAMPIRLDDLDYDLPPGRIAQHPAARREDARLLVVDRASGALVDSTMARLGEWLRPGDALALNETRVRPARIHMRRASGGQVELLIVRPEPGGCWRVLARPAKKAPTGATLTSEDGSLALEVVDQGGEGERLVRVVAGDLDAALESYGEIPLPPYIHRPPAREDRERYQTVFARVDGAVAAPTAGLHFSEALLASLVARGVARVPVLLHVGPGTFRPVSAADPREHRMDEEWFEVTREAAEALNAARAAGGRIVAVGTTAVRALESACDANGGALGEARGWTRKYILPPYEFHAVDALLTNFHLPRTTLLLLVAAFAGVDLTRRTYAHAVEHDYRFYSYGDATLVV
jgi:S-adenosylmethionine:tRNA ribosyltransferase-isomerase